MTIDKSGGLFRLAVGLMRAMSTVGIAQDLTPLVNHLALYFQVYDDLINLVDPDFLS